MNYHCVVQEDENGDAYIVFPDEMIEELGWAVGDTLVWSIEDGRCILRKRQDDSSNEA